MVPCKEDLSQHDVAAFRVVCVKSLNNREGMGKREPSYTVAGNVYWYSPYGEQ